MNIVDFTAAHIEQAEQIALLNYNGERACAPGLPLIESIPDLTTFTENGMGVAALEGDELVGYLCGVSPFENAFGSTNVTGVFSPMGAHGAVSKNRPDVYGRMYQAAGEKWAKAGASSHAVCLYAHDKKIHELFSRYGFGIRCVDAICGLEPPKKNKNAKAEPVRKPNPEVLAAYEFYELTRDELPQILPLDHLLDAHMAACPTFILRPSRSLESFTEEIESHDSIFFAAKYAGHVVAYIRAELDGETFIKDTPGYFHVKGAFCLPEHRGKGVQYQLLQMLIEKLKAEGYTSLGVDFESINPAAWGFWLKHFTAYTYSVVRRIDENALTQVR